MAPSKIRKALGAVKDQTSIGLAKASSSSTLAELEVAIVKATRHDEYPAEEKHVRDILSLTSYSRANVAASVALLSRRLGKTRSWAVALKALVVIHRLLADGDPVFEQEVFFATRRGTRMLNMAEFRDAAGSRSGRWDLSAFVRTYARYLDERLEYKMQGRKCRGGVVAVASPGRMGMVKEVEDEEEGEGGEAATPARSTPLREMRTERLFGKAQHLERLLDRILACRPTGAAKENRIVAMALYPIVKESFHIYLDLSEIVATFVDRFMELPVSGCVRIHDLFSKLSKQFEELDAFHFWARSSGVARPSEYPDIDHITHKKLQVIEDFIRDRSDSSPVPAPEPASAPAEEPVDNASTTDAVNEVKALPPPPMPMAAAGQEEPKQLQEEKEEIVQQSVKMAAEAVVVDFLNLEADTPTTEHHVDSLALALFDGGETKESSALQPWEAFKDATDWEKAIVESASSLEGQKAKLAGGFNMLMLDGMYMQGEVAAAAGGGGVSGSASSMAAGLLTGTRMLELPAPVKAGSADGSGDPFTASASVAPPPWVQMSEMERMQRLLVEEQQMWQQYAKDGMQGKLPSATGGAAYPYTMGGYTQRL